MTYCGSLCERADLGFTIEALLAKQVMRADERQPARQALVAGWKPLLAA